LFLRVFGVTAFDLSSSSVGWFSRWRRSRILQHTTLDAALWRATVERYPFIHALSDEELARLRELVVLFLHDKSIQGAAGMAISRAVRVAIAAQACVLILNLGLHYYRGWVEVIVYPDEFVAEYDYVDDAGVAHRVQEPMTGESWERGPVLLSWADAQEAGKGTAYNVVIHEFAHKLDMLNGEPNGFPPLHADMSRERWSSALAAAYEQFCREVDSGRELDIDEYAAESPAEFFAVISEVFFESPASVRQLYPEVYTQFSQFYRQDPAARHAAAAAARSQAAT
jgi:Mlc titration factor MtfA (ptsG expression regulator)